MDAFEGFTENDKYAIKHKTIHTVIQSVHCPYYISKNNSGQFVRYGNTELPLTRFKYYKEAILTFESEESANHYLDENKERTDITQFEVVLRITPEEEEARLEKRKKLSAIWKERKRLKEEGVAEKPLVDKLSSTSYEKTEDESFDGADEDDFESQIMRDLENGDGDLHGL